MATVLQQQWIESEAGWGVRPDGCSLHESEVKRSAYIAAYWRRLPPMLPSEYSAPVGAPTIVQVNTVTMEHLRQVDGLRLPYTKLPSEMIDEPQESLAPFTLTLQASQREELIATLQDVLRDIAEAPAPEREVQRYMTLDLILKQLLDQ